MMVLEIIFLPHGNIQVITRTTEREITLRNAPGLSIIVGREILTHHCTKIKLDDSIAVVIV